MTEINTLQQFFDETTLRDMDSIFHQANGCSLGELEEQALILRLVEIIQKDKHCRHRLLNSSPTGKNHIIVSLGACMLINIYGIVFIFDSPLYFEGDISIENIRWIEDDHLLLLDAYNIPSGKIETYICHYSNDSDAFVYFTPAKRAWSETVGGDNHSSQFPPAPTLITVSI